MQTKFTKVSDNEYKFEYKGHKFLLKENDRGVYGIGRAIQLYQLDGLKKEHIKEICWTKSDNHGGDKKNDSYLKGIHSWIAAQKGAIEYLEKLL